ncbi:cytoplasmic protein [Suillus paluster]|uniref:cytoplasmic protein n=1 Tax=Suillus paluster TaxID=48578 RepID=UPI001B86F254|nr:cytoplasmic protein [Suillus paluster]KAG1740847.1 cytoplasmic protein [Suillus paluster]
MLPTDDDKENLLLSCRYDDLDEIQDFVTKFGPEALSSVRDDNGNTVLHMTCGNGHIDVLNYLLPLISPSILSAQNSAGSTALHWAALNQHLEVAQKLVHCTGGPGVDLIDIKNTAGISPLGEAEMIGWDEGARWLVQEMKLDETSSHDVNDSKEDGPVETSRDIEVEIRDADGEVAKMTISDSESPLDSAMI